MSEITTANANDVNHVQGQLQILQQRISAVETESCAGESGRIPSSIIVGRNEQASISSRNKSGDRSIYKVKVRISSHSNSKCTISETHPGTLSTRKMDSNANTYCLGTNFIVIEMTESTSNVHPYNNSYEPMYNVPMVTGTSTYRDINTDRYFIFVIKEALYYGKKLGHYLINPNQLQAYGIMFCYYYFYSNI